MHTPWKNLSYNVPKTRRYLYILIGINVAVFLLSLIFEPLNIYLRLPSNTTLLLNHFWTPFTYLFVNDGFIGIIFNLLWLYGIGQIFEEYLGNDRIVGVYLLGGLAGAILYVLISNITQAAAHTNFLISSFIAGGSVSIFTIIVATATMVPAFTVKVLLWPVQLKWLVLIYVIFDLFNISSMGTGLITAHAGAALFGFFYIKQLKNGNDWIAKIANVFKQQSKLKIVSSNPQRRGSYRPRQEDVDAILDKISKVGYENLSKEEKEVLFRASKNDN